MPHPDTLEATHTSAPGLISSPSGIGGGHELDTETLTYLLIQSRDKLRHIKRMSTPSTGNNWPTKSRDKMRGMYPSVSRKKGIVEQEARREEGEVKRKKDWVW